MAKLVWKNNSQLKFKSFYVQVWSSHLRLYNFLKII